jgi:hypothetical protein
MLVLAYKIKDHLPARVTEEDGVDSVAKTIVYSSITSVT